MTLDDLTHEQSRLYGQVQHKEESMLNCKKERKRYTTFGVLQGICTAGLVGVTASGYANDAMDSFQAALFGLFAVYSGTNSAVNLILRSRESKNIKKLENEVEQLKSQPEYQSVSLQ